MNYPLPTSFLDAMVHVQGFDRKSFEAVHTNPEQVVSVRLHPDKPFEPACSKLSFEGAVPWCPHGKYLKERPAFTLDPLLHAGAYYVQEPSSMFLWTVLEQTVGKETPGLKVLDLCGAPGGKTTLLTAYFKDALVVANEVIKSRASVLVENLVKWGSERVVVTNNDPGDFTGLQHYFDVIVVDAPCSGSGLFRKDSAAIGEWSEANVTLCSQRQKRILADIYPALKKEGILIYSTCSYSEEEDEDMLDWLIENFAVTGCRLSTDPRWGIVETKGRQSESYGYRFFPDRIKGEGFFIAALRKTDGEERSLRAPQLAAASRREIDRVTEWINNPGDLFFFRQNENILAIPVHWREDMAVLQKNLYIRKAGVTVGSVKGDELIPDHGLAMSLLTNDRIPFVNLDYPQSIGYLKKKELRVEDARKGWNLVRYCDIPLGWIKVLHNRINNYYPVNWRILKD